MLSLYPEHLICGSVVGVVPLVHFSVVLGGSYSFFNIDSVFDFLLSIGMKPLVELSFMPNQVCYCFCYSQGSLFVPLSACVESLNDSTASASRNIAFIVLVTLVLLLFQLASGTDTVFHYRVRCCLCLCRHFSMWCSHTEDPCRSVPGPTG